ncbi:hypothetical protein JCM5353_000916 [Sporobolomyces roseus]
MIPFIPPELLRTTLASLSDPVDLAQCCTTSRTFLSIARPLLYKEVEFRVFGTYACPASRLQTYIEPGSRTLLDSLKREAHLRQLVQNVTIRERDGGGWADYKYRTTYELHLPTLVKGVFHTFPRAKLITLDNLPQRNRVDEVVASIQNGDQDVFENERVTSRPAFAMMVYGSMGPNPNFQGAYERFRWDFLSARENLNVEEVLRLSQHTLRSLDIPLEDSTSLALFQNLERLSLRLAFYIPPNVIRNLTRAISNLSSLQTLRLYGSAQEEDLKILLESGLLARSLPPNLGHLTLDFKLTSARVLAFLPDLPTTSKLRRFNFFCKVEEGEEAREQFRSRGIMVSVNEKWDTW